MMKIALIWYGKLISLAAWEVYLSYCLNIICEKEPHCIRGTDAAHWLMKLLQVNAFAKSELGLKSQLNYDKFLGTIQVAFTCRSLFHFLFDSITCIIHVCFFVAEVLRSSEKKSLPERRWDWAHIFSQLSDVVEARYGTTSESLNSRSRFRELLRVVIPDESERKEIVHPSGVLLESFIIHKVGHSPCGWWNPRSTL